MQVSISLVVREGRGENFGFLKAGVKDIERSGGRRGAHRRDILRAKRQYLSRAGRVFPRRRCASRAAPFGTSARARADRHTGGRVRPKLRPAFGTLARW